MYQYLHKYFSLYKNLSLPGIGSFNTTAQPARIDFTNKTLHAPRYTIHYNSEHTSTDDKFYKFLAKETGLKYDDAAHQLKEFTTQITDKLKDGVLVKFEGIGTLVKKEEGYLFDAGDNYVSDFFPSITAGRVIRQNAEHNVRVGEDDKTSTEMQQRLTQTIVKEERWWISALVLAVIGIAAILYYYSR
ncbi:MAG TPA: hypothetical protein PLA68_00960 [Panacibacter sp.]|nr:hypothetical protein [Panacibacter sp.]